MALGRLSYLYWGSVDWCEMTRAARAAEWVGIHMLHSTGNLFHVHTHPHAHALMYTLVFESQCHQPLKSPTASMCNVLSVNISSIPTLMWQNITTRAGNKQAVRRKEKQHVEQACFHSFSSSLLPHHTVAPTLKRWVVVCDKQAAVWLVEITMKSNECAVSQLGVMSVNGNYGEWVLFFFKSFQSVGHLTCVTLMVRDKRW